ncbi:2,3-bisphosphoglycerate-independent phosphoglycerate mutase, partial [Candidatus Micrarchaeota archaeon]|nr:2,3-bisphosphoglycerate-independent phosphoglycerate mutase [Candidatus Micrarchaeota archaeon]
MSSKKAVLLIMDGLGDLPMARTADRSRQSGSHQLPATPKTPLQAAKKPNLDRLAKEGITGLLSPVGRGIIPGSDTSHLEILGYPPAIFYCGRGPLEALGTGMALEEQDVAFRANFATVENGKVVDRRAGRIDSEEARKLEKYLSTKIEDVQVIFKHSVQHRGAVVLRGNGLSPDVGDTDPHESGQIIPCRECEKSDAAKKTARIVNAYMKFAMEKLSAAPENRERTAKKLRPANALLLRGAGVYRKIPSMIERFGLNAACMADGALYRGVATYIGMDVFMLKG